MNETSSHILVPLDGSPNAERAIRPAAVVARATGGSLRFLHAATGGASERQKQAELFPAYIANLAKKYGLQEAEFEYALVEGPAVETVLAESAGARLLALSSHGRGGFRAAILGSVADRIVRSATVPVLLVRGTRVERGLSGFRRLVVCLDGSDEGEVGLAFARELAPHLGAELLLLRAFAAPPPVTGEDVLLYNPTELVSQLRDEAEKYLAAVALPGERLHAVELPPPLAVNQLVTTEQADGIVLTTRGLGRARRLFLGSVTDKVIRSAQVPVFIIPVTGGAGERDS